MARLAALCLFGIASSALGAGGPLGIDHRWNYDQSGIWNRGTQRLIEFTTIGGAVAGALWEGGDSRLGRTYWEALDAGALGLGTGELAKRAFGRDRPIESNNPDQWRNQHRSFPSTEVSTVAGVVTPFVLEYGRDHPAVWALEAIPAVIGVGRMKVQAHWQTDILAGWALGTAAGYYAHQHNSPFFLSVMPHGIAIGINKRF